MARKTIFVSDMSGETIDGPHAVITIKFSDGRRHNRILDVTVEEAEQLGGREVKRRGRKPKSDNSETVLTSL